MLHTHLKVHIVNKIYIYKYYIYIYIYILYTDITVYIYSYNHICIHGYILYAVYNIHEY